MADINDLDTRISVLETEFENAKRTIEKMEKVVDDNYEGTMSIKSRLDRWNGSIPHLVEDVKLVNAKADKLLQALNNNTISDADSSAKVKILWAVLAAIASSGITLLIKFLVH